MSHRTARRLATALLGAAVTLGAAGCAQDEGEHAGHGARGEVSATEHNDADVAFASDMLQHHAQALSMVDLTRDRPLRPEVGQLAEQVREAQAPEIQTFTEWLTDWDEEVPETMRDHANAGHGDDHGGGDIAESMEGMDTDMPGMMSAEDMTALESAPDEEFEALWLEMMIEHHEGAIEMAEEQQESGRYEAAIELAEDIAESQAAQVDTMQELLG
jgi:uncharacterized protein (DUF305 family)